jgi:hypothetical protein
MNSTTTRGVNNMRSILFLEQVLKAATKPEDIEFIISLLFDLKNDMERRG